MQVDLNLWQRLFPELHTRDVICVCGRKPKEWKTFLYKDLVGIESKNCKCGRSGIIIAQTRNTEAAKKWIAALSCYSLQ